MKKIFYRKDGTVRIFWAIFVLYFNKKVKPLYHPDQGKDMLMLAVVFEIIRLAVSVGKRFFASESLLSDGVIGVIFLLLVFSVTRYVFPIKLKDIGLRKISQWNRYEIIFLLLIAPLVFAVLWYFNREPFAVSLHEYGLVTLLITFVFYLSWGFYQEWIYRGFIQTEFTRRYGAVNAIIFANLLFTFGPLHFNLIYHGNYTVLAGTFAVGLIFGILYHRSYNLWIVGILHGICNWFLIGLP